jgi:hypothetical protein
MELHQRAAGCKRELDTTAAKLRSLAISNQFSPRRGYAGCYSELSDVTNSPNRTQAVVGKQKDGYVGIGLVYSHAVKDD